MKSPKRLSRREFLKTLAGGLFGTGFAHNLVAPRTAAAQSIPPNGFVVSAMEGALRRAFGDYSMALDLRMLDFQVQEHFALQLNAERLLPTASCFKAFLVLYYFMNTPPEAWDAAEGSTIYSVGVYSNNRLTGTLLQDVGQRISGYGNALEKFNDFLIYTLAMQQGLHTWAWEGSPTVGIRDPRFAPSETRFVEVRGARSLVDNVTTAADLARGWRVILTSISPDPYVEYPQLPAAAAATRDLLSIRADDYESPIERVYTGAYTGKDGILPADTLPDVGRVVNDAGIIYTAHGAYTIAFLSAGESEVIAIDVLRQVVEQIGVYEEFLNENAGG